MQQQEVFLIKEGEIVLKGLNKSSFEKKLIKNIKLALHPAAFDVKSSQSTILLQPQTANDLALMEPKLKKIFGVARYCKAFLCASDIESINRVVASKFENRLKSCSSFRIKARRSNKKFELNSMQIGQTVGSFLCSAFPHLKVNLSNLADLTIFVEVRSCGTYVYCENENFAGAGGLPVGCSGSAMLLISGGIDSPVAGWLMAKRGIRLHAVHFFSPPYTSERALNKVENLLEILSEWAGKIYFYCVNFTEIQETIKNKCDETLGTVIGRRAMNKIAELIAAKSNLKLKSKILALINGESLGQVASQTLEAISCSKSSVGLPILQPLIGLDKTEIVTIAKKIGTFSTSTLPFEDCCTVFVAKHPKTKPNLPQILENEKAIANLNNLIEAAASNAQFKIIG